MKTKQFEDYNDAYDFYCELLGEGWLVQEPVVLVQGGPWVVCWND